MQRGWSHSGLVRIALVAALACGVPAAGHAAGPQNAGNNTASTNPPFRAAAVASFDTPWSIAVLDQDWVLVTERPGKMWLTSLSGQKVEVTGVPKVAASGQNGLLDVAPAPDFATSGRIYFTFMEPGTGGSGLALARAQLKREAGRAQLDGLEVIWRQSPKGSGGHPGANIAFAPDGKYLFLTVGDRQRLQPAQDLDSALGKVLRLNLDGSTPPDNPLAGKDGGGELRAQVWSYGHRNPYGLAFAPDGKLWEHEMGPRGGDELNLVEPGKNYGWPLVSYGDTYGGKPFARPPTRPDLQEPALYWNPVISPAGMVFYDGAMFPEWRGSALIGSLSTFALVRVSFDAKGVPRESGRWDLGNRIRDVAVATDGSVLVIEDTDPGRLLRLTPR
ncbi:PQQ-dependent sugar dehydrogenase [Xanthobacteraceae bacterium A53D]